MISRTILVPFACIATTLPALADTIVMKDGSRLEGRVLKEAGDAYVLEVQVTKSIRDEKTVAKSDVAEIIAEKTDEKEFEKLAGLVPTADFLSADEYTRRVGLVSKFLSDHPKSAKAAEAQTILATLKSEAEVIAGGGIKMEGKMISGEEYQADLYDIDAKILEKRIREAAARGDKLGALRGIARINADFRSTNSRTALEPLKAQLLRSYKAEIDQLVSSYESRVAEREANLARMSRESRMGTEQALKEELDAATARYNADVKNEQLWVTTHPFLRESLDDAQEAIAQEMTGEDFKPQVDAGRVYRNILRFIAKNDDPGSIRDVILQGEQALIPERYLKNLKDAAAAKGVEP